MTDKTLVMGVLNVTPDSFSDGGLHGSHEAAIAHAHALTELGADIIDVGGESTRPGALPVDREEELRRVLPVIRMLAADGIDVSIDTLHAETAQAAVAAGARFINDVSGGLHDPGMLAAAAWASAEHGARFIIGHWRGIPDAAHQRSVYTDVVAEVCDALGSLAAEAIRAGVAREHIVLDPGLGFDKTGEQCWQILRRLSEITALGFPVLIGASRKRMLAEVLAELRSRHVSPEDRDLATATVSALAARSGAWGVRVHDVDSTVQALAVERAWSAAPRDSAAQAATAQAPEAQNPAAQNSVVQSSVVQNFVAQDSVAQPVQASVPHDRITVTGLEVYAHHGVFDFERETGQPFVIDVSVAVDLAAAAAGDSLERTVHYGELAQAVAEAVRRDPVDLIETVAERVADVALGFTGVAETTVTVHKPQAPIDEVFADVSVTVVRSKAGA